MKRETRLTKLATIDIYFSPNLRRLLGIYETLNGKNFVVKIRRNLYLKDFLDVFYHELTHIVICLLESVQVSVENLNSSRGLVRVKVNEKSEERICDKIAREATKTLMEFLKKHANTRR